MPSRLILSQRLAKVRIYFINIHVIREYTHKVDEGIGALLVVVDLPELPVLGEHLLELLEGYLAGQAADEQPAVRVERLLSHVEGLQVQLGTGDLRQTLPVLVLEDPVEERQIRETLW